ncbi:MAG: class I SAM-dependent methyltransferase [Alphaproteobacteria bacterium]
MSDATATAHTAWDEQWKSADGREAWLRPAPDVHWRARAAIRAGAHRVLDLGCGVGRHALLFAELGLDVYAMDGSATGVSHLAEEARRAGHCIDVRIGMMTDLPYDDAAFDYVLAFNVIYHGDGTVVRRAIAEIARVLRPGAVYQGTMLAKRNVNYGHGREVAPDTFVADDADGDKAHPHFYCDAAGLVDLFADFELETLYLREHEKPGSWHWHLTAQKRG